MLYLRILFDTRDVSRVKQFAQRQFAKILSGKASLQDLTFAKEFRGVGIGQVSLVLYDPNQEVANMSFLGVVE